MIKVDPSFNKRTRVADRHDHNHEMPSPKRRRDRSPVEDDETKNATPTPSHFGNLTIGWPYFPQRRSPTKASSRSGSPTKPTIINNLAQLVTPVRLVYPDNATDAIGDEEGRVLWKDLRKISRDSKILPSAIRSDLENLVGSDSIDEDMWDGYELGEGDRDDRCDSLVQPEQYRTSQPTAQQELLLIRQLTVDTRKAEDRRKNETGWNEDVHKPAFRLALGTHPVVQAENVASTRLAPPFRPPLSDPFDQIASATDASSVTETSSSWDSAAYHKIVDYALVLDLDSAQSTSDAATYASLARRIRCFINAQPYSEQWINAIQYEPLRYLPSGVTIETKTNTGTREEAFVQLGVWIAAWHRRMRLMLDSRGQTQQLQDEPCSPMGGNFRRLLSVPAILVSNGSWELFMVIEAPGANPAKMETVRFLVASLLQHPSLHVEIHC